jgi:hypothetical protein
MKNGLRHRLKKLLEKRDDPLVGFLADIGNALQHSDYAEVLLQIAIVMASIAILSGSRTVFHFSLVSAVMGSFLSLDGLLPAVRIPFLR